MVYYMLMNPLRDKTVQQGLDNIFLKRTRSLKLYIRTYTIIVIFGKWFLHRNANRLLC